MPDPIFYPNFPGAYQGAFPSRTTSVAALADEARELYTRVWVARTCGVDLDWQALGTRVVFLDAQADRLMVLEETNTRWYLRQTRRVVEERIRREKRWARAFHAVTVGGFALLVLLTLLLLWANSARLRAARAEETIRATWYQHRPDARLADGARYGRASKNVHFVAANAWPLGTRLRLTCRGRSLTATVRDRIGHGSRLDLAAHTARALDPDYRRVGRLPVRVRLLSSPARSQRRGVR